MMGDAKPTHPRLTREALVANYREVMELLGRVSTGDELDGMGRYGKRTYHKHFGGHAALLKAVGDTTQNQHRANAATKGLVLRKPVRRGRPVKESAELGVAPAHLTTLQRLVVNNFLRLRKRFGRTPLLTEIYEVCASADLTKAFGDFLGLLECVNEHEAPNSKARPG